MLTRFVFFILLVLTTGCKPVSVADQPRSHDATNCAGFDVFDRIEVPVTGIGRSLPTSDVPISDINGLVGEIPGQNRLGELTHHFRSLVFDTECDGEIYYVRKWNDVIRMATGPARDVPERLRSILPVLSEISGLEFITNVDYRNANVEIFEEPNYPDNCFALYRIKPDGSFDFAQIQMGRKIPASERTECLLEELSQILGPFNDVTTIEDTMWRPLELKTYDSLTWSDAVILRTLYDERIRPGMHRDVAMPIVRVIIGELLAELNR
tara:strand:- start:18 stop:818 length:801 start_codon:yes stop_codon:yes gene_type:complete